MFNKVLVAEDLDTINLSMVQALKDLNVNEIHYAKYCDEAYLKIKRALHDKTPYDLLISDLSFKTDHRESKINSGDELIDAAKKAQADLKTIVFSIGRKKHQNRLFRKRLIDGLHASSNGFQNQCAARRPAQSGSSKSPSHRSS